MKIVLAVLTSIVGEKRGPFLRTRSQLLRLLDHHEWSFAAVLIQTSVAFHRPARMRDVWFVWDDAANRKDSCS
jgi:hypothetical protein